MRRRPPRSTRTDPHCPATTRFGSVGGLVDKAKFAVPEDLKSVADAARALKGGAGASALFTLSGLEVAGRDKARNIRQAVIAASHASSRYTATLGDKNKAKNDDSGLKSLAIAGDAATEIGRAHV